MSSQLVASRPVVARRPRVGALTLAALVAFAACIPRAPSGLLRAASQSGEGEAVFATLPTDFAPVQVGDPEFTAALAMLVLDMPLRVATLHPPLYVGRKLALVAGPDVGETWQATLVRDYA